MRQRIDLYIKCHMHTATMCTSPRQNRPKKEIEKHDYTVRKGDPRNGIAIHAWEKNHGVGELGSR